MSEGNLLTVPSKTKPPVSILKTKPTNAARLAREYKIFAHCVKKVSQIFREFFYCRRGKANRVSVEINSRQSIGNTGSKEKVL